MVSIILFVFLFSFSNTKKYFLFFLIQPLIPTAILQNQYQFTLNLFYNPSLYALHCASTYYIYMPIEHVSPTNWPPHTVHPKLPIAHLVKRDFHHAIIQIKCSLRCAKHAPNYRNHAPNERIQHGARESLIVTNLIRQMCTKINYQPTTHKTRNAEGKRNHKSRARKLFH